MRVAIWRFRKNATAVVFIPSVEVFAIDFLSIRCIQPVSSLKFSLHQGAPTFLASGLLLRPSGEQFQCLASGKHQVI